MLHDFFSSHYQVSPGRRTLGSPLHHRLVGATANHALAAGRALGAQFTARTSLPVCIEDPVLAMMDVLPNPFESLACWTSVSVLFHNIAKALLGKDLLAPFAHTTATQRLRHERLNARHFTPL